MDPLFGGAIYQQVTGGGTQYSFIEDAYEGFLSNNSGTHIPLTLTFFSSVFGGGQDKYFPLSHEQIPPRSHTEHGNRSVPDR